MNDTSQRPAGVSMVGWLGERLTIGQLPMATAPRVAHGAPAGPRNSDQFNAMPGMLSR